MNRMMNVAVLFAMLFVHNSSAQTTQPTPAPPTSAAPQAPQPPRQPPCTSAEHRQFDFWIGDWDVFNPAGKNVGTNLIKPIMGGCVLHEHWKGGGNFAGESFNLFEASRKVWHQTWVDMGGNALIMDGKFENGSMTLSDRHLPGKANPNAINEFTWTPNADGSVRQHWRVSTDGGATWTTSFDGKYVRSARPQPTRLQ